MVADTGGDELIQVLEDLGPQLPRKAVLFPCLDRNVELISRFRDRLESWYHIMLPPPQVVEMMMDKTSFYRYAQEAGFQIPKTDFLYSRAEAVQAAQAVTYPAVLKPPSSKTSEWLQETHLKAFKVTNPDELLSTFDRCHRFAKPLILQEWIEGTDANLYSCNCYFNRDGDPVVTLVSRKIRQWPPRIGETCLGEEVRNDAVLNETLRLFRAVRFYGLGYVELKRDERSGEYFIIEPNIGRPTARSGIAEASGVEMIYAAYCDAAGKPLPRALEQRYAGVKWIHLRRDFQSSFHYWRRGELSLRDWWRSLRGPKAYALFSLRDPAPFLADLAQALRLFLSSEERQKRVVP